MGTDIHQDEKTLSYFAESCPEYDVSRLNAAIQLVSNLADPSSAILEVGCGNGNLLEFFRQQTGFNNLTGFDFNPRALEIARELTGCATIEGSILDDAMIDAVEKRFDVVLVTAVLHHLTGRTRRSSMAMARAALINSLKLVEPGGTLIVVEPTFAPSPILGSLFHLKRMVSRFTDRRVEIFSMWNNIGPPVVSYLTDGQLQDLLALDDVALTTFQREDTELTRFMKLAGLTYRHDITAVLQKRG